ncbi:hypothetical protein [Arthrobacter humicola]|uniref:hypothetical protein n=1 Tax=Arthrobacter humicola TaxID=409291 RepID=UPI001FAB9C3E|nr:hypothetical protein [Arthrobacter humicola]MCI9870555.1 hypothetical protein [Arthrobacter humicola]
MSIRIRSLQSAGPLWVPLTGGTSLRLAPGQVSQEFAEVEVQDNQAVDSLVSRGIIEVVAGARAAGGRDSKPAAAAKAAPKKEEEAKTDKETTQA